MQGKGDQGLATKKGKRGKALALGQKAIPIISGKGLNSKELRKRPELHPETDPAQPLQKLHPQLELIAQEAPLLTGLHLQS